MSKLTWSNFINQYTKIDRKLFQMKDLLEAGFFEAFENPEKLNTEALILVSKTGENFLSKENIDRILSKNEWVDPYRLAFGGILSLLHNTSSLYFKINKEGVVQKKVSRI